MSEIKDKNKKTGNKEVEPEYTEEEVKQIKAMEEIVKEIERKPLTKILEMVKFENDQDAEVFRRLPLTNCQKEELLCGILFPELFVDENKDVKK